MRYFIGLTLFVISFLFAQPRCVLFYYKNSDLPLDILYTYDWIVLNKENTFVKKVKELFYMKKRAKLIAYLSLGEVSKNSKDYEKLKNYAIGENPNWDSLILDIRKREYVNYLLKEEIPKLLKDFDGVFLDTLDSYKLVAKKEEWNEFESSLVEIIKRIKEKYPNKLLIVNRPFEIIDKIHSYIDAFVVESLFYTYKGGSYVPTEERYRKTLLSMLYEVKKYGVPIVVIDYVNPREKGIARQIVEKIKHKGFIPYVSNKYLTRVGFSECKLIPRKIILLYDSKLFPIRQEADVHRLIQMPLEYLGFIPEIYDVNGKLPEVYPELGYSGIVTFWIKEKTERLEEFLIKAKREGLKLFFVEDIPFRYNSPYLKELGIRFEDNKDKRSLKLRVIYKEKGDGFEAPYFPQYTDTFIKVEKGRPLIVVENSLRQKHIPFAITDWGGYAVDNSLINSEELWVYNPFEVFKRVFKPQFPALDLTTENGMRILTAHIDGDAFFGNADFDPSRTTGEVIRDEIIKVFKIPHTVSIIEAEVAPWGLYPEKSKKLEEVAKSIFSLPNVEPASHSFSHPYTWRPEIRPPIEAQYGFHLPVKGYKFNPRREVFGSLNYINNLIKDLGKRVRVFLWTGECNPSGETVRLTYLAKVYNVNGGDTTITRESPFLKNVSPSGVNFGPYFQVYAPMQNENVYTNLWSNPFWGYIKVIQTFELTDKPYRLKPISIYYHFYSGQKLASLNALKKVYRYALSQEVIPMYLSEYARKVLEFRHTAILKDGKAFVIKNDGVLRTLRVPSSFGFPDLKKSKGVVGYRKIGNNIYVHLDDSGYYRIYFTKKEPKDAFRLVFSNGKVKNFLKIDNKISFELRSYISLSAKIFAGNCRVFIDGKEQRKKLIDLKKEKKYAKIEAICTN